MNMTERRVAVVHDWMFSRRGGERVLERILNLYPQADLFILFGDPQNTLVTRHHHQVTQSFLSKVPGVSKIYKYLLPFFPIAIESLNLSSYDLIISSSSCAAKGVIPPPHAVHISYIHSPMRYAWDMERTYFPDSPPGIFRFRPLHAIRKVLLSRLRVWDTASAARVDAFCCNSEFVKRRIELYYHRKATTITPPVDVEKYYPVGKNRPRRQKTVLLFGAWVPYKRMDLALDALRSGLPRDVKILAAGAGELFRQTRERHLHTPNVEFTESPSDAQLADLYLQAHVLAFPGVEDFGIIPVEAMAAGVWVVGPNLGGTAQTIKQGLTGIQFKWIPGDESQSLVNLVSATQEALSWDSPEPSETLRSHLQQYSGENFDKTFINFTQSILELRGAPQ